MLLGFDAPVRGPLARPEAMARVAGEGEALGFDYITVSDHIVIPRDINARYPYTDSGEFPAVSRGEWQELLIAMAFLAGKTARLRLVTSVMVVPYRQPVLAAKALASIDILSSGRLTVACGAGWLKEEFEAMGAPPFAERGAVTDEYLQAYRALWTEENPRFEGRYVRFGNLIFAPKPVQKPHPPLWIGGESGPALRRAARLGDGWYPIGSNPEHPLNTLPRYRAAVERLRRLAQEAGRDPAAIALAYRSTEYGRTELSPMIDGERRLFSGGPEAVAADLKALRAMGVTAVDFGFATPTLDATLANLRRFAAEVMPLVK